MNEQRVHIGAMFGDDDEEVARRNYRHTSEQIQELENFYKDCPFPNEDQRSQLGRRLNLEPKQIKVWFQNKRNKTKKQMERDEYIALTEEHERLRGVQEQLKHAMLSSSCISCRRLTNTGNVDYEVQKLIIENTRLKQELNRFGSPMQFPIGPGRNVPPEHNLGGGTTTMNKIISMNLEIATAAMKELKMLGQMDCPFWTTSSIFKNESLNYEEFRSAFNIGVRPPGFFMESSRETGVVCMGSLALVKILMDTRNWVNVFTPIVYKATAHTLIPTGFGAVRSGSLLEIKAEFQIISPLVPKRQVRFLRYCEELSRGLWVVVDVTPPQEKLSYGGCRRLPSGLIIEDMANGYSKVTWTEQAEYDETHIQKICRGMIGSGGLGAKRWLTTLQRQSESISTLTSIHLDQLYPGLSSKGAREIVRVAQRMVLNYYTSISGSSVIKWETIKTQNIQLMIRRNVNEPGEHTGLVLSASTSDWFPAVRQQTLLHFLSDLSSREQWDILSANTSMERTVHIQKAKRHGNYITLLRILDKGSLILQEVWNDASEAGLVYTPLEASSIEEAMRGDNAETVEILPCGFSIVPDNENGAGCLLTLGLQFLVSSNPTVQLTQQYVKAVEDIMAATIAKVKAAVGVQI